MLDLALELAQLRKPLLVLPLLAVELGDQRLLLGARQRAAAVGDARRRPLLPARLDAPLEGVDARARAVDASPSAFASSHTSAAASLCSPRSARPSDRSAEALERLDGERAAVVVGRRRRRGRW